MIYLLLLKEFLLIGLLSIGGGLATLPFLINLASKYQWYTYAELINMIAISESTPGPIGINLATFVGYRVAGFGGGLIASLAVFLPGMLLMLVVAKSLKTIQKAAYYQNLFYGLRPAVLALISYAAYLLLLNLWPAMTKDITSLLFTTFIVGGSLLALTKFKLSPIIVILLAGVSGFIFGLI